MGLPLPGTCPAHWVAVIYSTPQSPTQYPPRSQGALGAKVRPVMTRLGWNGSSRAFVEIIDYSTLPRVSPLCQECSTLLTLLCST
jgi:hypothetical protein